MPFEEFTFKKRPIRDIPMVTILKQGIFGLNQACYNKHFKKYKYVIFLFDRENNKIGLKPTNEATSNTYNIRVSRDGKLANISAIAFLKFYKIPHNETKSYTCFWNEKEKILEVELSK